MVQTQEVQSAKKVLTREDCLRLIPKHKLHSILRRHHLNREIIIGLVGLRGDGKSGSGASVALIDYLLEDKPVWSNMNISCNINIDDVTARQYGLNKGGSVKFQSEELDKEGILRLDPKYHDGCIFTDEVNMEFAEARRAMSNTNLYVDKVAQQIRKFRNSWIYTAISEMFVDSRLRELTDVFIKCEETALSVAGLESRKPIGQDFKWNIYPMSGYLAGREMSYGTTHKALPPVYFHFSPLHGIYDDKQAQAAGKMKYGIKFSREDEGGAITEMSTEQSPEIKAKIRDLAWLEGIAQEMAADGRRYIPCEEIWELPEVVSRRITKPEVSQLLEIYFAIGKARRSIEGKNMTVYEVPEAMLLANS
jgi:hypothetical protein